LAVVERDNARVQCFFADDLSPAGVFGHGDLTKPYGIAVSCVEDAPVAIITDGNGKGGHFAFAYRLRLTDGRVEPGLARSFGDSDGTGAINEPESIVVDDEHERILFCDEDDLNVKVYTIDGKFTGTTFADEIIFGEPEGIALMSGGPSTGDSSKGTSGPSGGWVILTDQREDLTVWHVFDREDYRRIGTFTGAPAIANTDGICILAEPFGPFRAGALFAVHDDQEIRGYDLADVTNQMGG
jgi:3-phytase